MQRSPLNISFREVAMSSFVSGIKEKLLTQLENINQIRWLFTSDPLKDFSRKRKLDFKEMIHFLLSMGGKSLGVELLEYFSYDPNVVTKSAFVQRRDKIHPEALEMLFHMFTDTIEPISYYEKYRLLAVDGSDLCISFNPEDQTTHFPNGPHAKGFNLLHMNALYDLTNRLYVDALIQPGRKVAERQALVKMVDRSTITGKVIIVGDRGYENYNACEHITQKGWDYVIRIKDTNSNGIASGLFLPKKEIFDIDYAFEMTRQQTKEVKANPLRYKFLPKNQFFDFLPQDSKETYPFKFRILRFPITETTYEVIITSLDRFNFPLEKIKEIYHMRWGIETSFRELKYAIGLSNFHAKKVAYILQEIFARLTMYNFCEAITTHVVILHADRKYEYQVNFTVAIAICLQFFRVRNLSPPNVEALIKKNILPLRPGRNDPRKVKTRSAVSFLYRVA
jgi:hypothetical protein